MMNSTNDAQNKDEIEDHGVKHNVVLRILCVFIFSLVLVYFLGIIYFNKHFYIGTKILDIPCGMLSVDDTSDAIIKSYEGYTLTIHGRNGLTDSIMARDVDLRLNPTDDLHRILCSQNPMLWFMPLFQSYTYDAHPTVSWNHDLLIKKFPQLSIFDAHNCKYGKDAYIGKYDDSERSFRIVEEEIGTMVKRSVATKRIENALLCLDLDVYLEDDECYYVPKVRSNNARLRRILDRVNRYVATEIKYDWNGQEVILNGGIISKWIQITEDRFTIDEIMMEEWIAEQAQKNDTYSEERIFQTYEKGPITVKSKAFGWKTNVMEERKALLVLIRNGEVGEREPIFEHKGYAKGKNDVGDSYVEIDLSAQKLYLWKDGKIQLESDIVSGNMTNGSGTPAGLFGLTYKQKDAVLRGADYTTPVKYWMPFNRNVGMHDATWRKKFGGKIYQTSGSHGCINLPLKKAEEIFEVVEKGFPVVCYY